MEASVALRRRSSIIWEHVLVDSLPPTKVTCDLRKWITSARCEEPRGRGAAGGGTAPERNVDEQKSQAEAAKSENSQVVVRTETSRSELLLPAQGGSDGHTLLQGGSDKSADSSSSSLNANVWEQNWSIMSGASELREHLDGTVDGLPIEVAKTSSYYLSCLGCPCPFVELIESDSKRTWCARNPVREKALQNVLHALWLAHPMKTYSQGLNLIVAMVLEQTAFEEELSFFVVLALVRDSSTDSGSQIGFGLGQLYHGDALNELLSQFEGALKEAHPDLARHLERNNLPVAGLIGGYFTTLFCSAFNDLDADQQDSSSIRESGFFLPKCMLDLLFAGSKARIFRGGLRGLEDWLITCAIHIFGRAKRGLMQLSGSQLLINFRRTIAELASDRKISESQASFVPSQIHMPRDQTCQKLEAFELLRSIVVALHLTHCRKGGAAALEKLVSSCSCEQGDDQKGYGGVLDVTIRGGDVVTVKNMPYSPVPPVLTRSLSSLGSMATSVVPRAVSAQVGNALTIRGLFNFVRYLLHIRFIDGDGHLLQFSVRKRYSSVLQLHRRIQRKLSAKARTFLPPLPKKTWLPVGYSSEAFVEARRRALTAYFDALLRMLGLAGDWEVAKFLSFSDVSRDELDADTVAKIASLVPEDSNDADGDTSEMTFQNSSSSVPKAKCITRFWDMARSARLDDSQIRDVLVFIQSEGFSRGEMEQVPVMQN